MTGVGYVPDVLRHLETQLPVLHLEREYTPHVRPRTDPVSGQTLPGEVALKDWEKDALYSRAASPSSPPGAPATAASCGSPGAVPLPTPMGAARRGARRPPGARLEATDESAAALERDGEADDVFEEEEEEEEGQASPPPQQQGDNGDGFERGGGAGTSQPWGLRPSAAAAALHLSDALAEPPAAAAPMAELPKSATKCNAQRDPTAARLAPRSASATALIKEARAALSADGPVRVRSAKQLFGAH